MALLVGQFMGNNGIMWWYATSDNGATRYRFSGADPEGQLDSMQQFCDLMEAGTEQVLVGLPGVLQLRGVDTQAVVNELFEANTQLMYVDEVIYTAAESLWTETDIVAAGERLAAFLLT